MTTKYFAILTNQGAARLANATALGTKLNIAEMAVGDGGDTLPTPDPAQTTLINERRRKPLNSLAVDANDPSQIIAEQIIPENEGGFFIREIGLYDDEGILIAVANCPETYKPLLAEGSGRTQTIRMILVVSSTAAIALKIDPSVVLATRQYVDDAVIEVKGYADKLMKDHEAKANPHKQYPLIENALKEMADAGLINKVLENLGLSEALKVIAGAMQKASNGSDIVDVAAFRKSLQLGAAATRNVGMGSASNLIDMDSIRFLAGGNGYLELPGIATSGNNLKFQLRWGNALTPINSNNTYTPDVAFPNTILFATGNRWAGGSNASMNVNAVGTQGIQIQNWAQSGYAENCAWIAVGY